MEKQYFEKLFQEKDVTIELVMDNISHHITYKDHIGLLAPFKLEEFKFAMFQMHSDKSPSPNRLNSGFYKRYWDVCDTGIFEECKWMEKE